MDAKNRSPENNTDNDPQKVKAEEPTLGQYLRNERKRKDLTVDELHAKTGINRSVLHALEHDLRQELPADVFVRGFIKLYAKTLNLDPQYALNLLHSRGSIQKEQEAIGSKDLLSSESLAESPLFTRKKLLFCLLLVLFGILAYVVYRYQPMKDFNIFSFNTSTLQTSAPPLNEAPPSARQLTSPVESETVQQQKEQEQIPTTSSTLPIEELPTTTNNSTGMESTVVEAPQSTPAPRSASVDVKPEKNVPTADQTIHTLTATFSEMTWVRTVLDNDEAKEAFFRPGSSASWQAKEKIEILLGNSGGASLAFDGTPVELKHNHDKVTRLSFP